MSSKTAVPSGRPGWRILRVIRPEGGEERTFFDRILRVIRSERGEERKFFDSGGI
jgi:hypothetical protein